LTAVRNRSNPDDLSLPVASSKSPVIEDHGRPEIIQQIFHGRESEFRDFVQNAVVPMHWVGADGTILWANKAELALLGYSWNEYVGRPIAEFHADQGAIEDILGRLGKREDLQGYRAKLRCKDGSTRVVRIYSNVFAERNEFVHTRCFTIDVTDRERSEARIAAQLAVTRLLAFPGSLREITDSVLETICGVSDCNIGAIWEVDREKQEIRCVRIWPQATHNFDRFEEVTISTRFNKGVGLPGRVWETNEPAWISDLTVDDNFPRKNAAHGEGLKSAFAFPISVKQNVLGVIEFYSRRALEPDQEFITMMAAIGIQIGQFIERHEESDAKNKLAAIVESSDDAIVSKDLKGVVTSWNKAAELTFGYTAAEMIGRPITTIIPTELLDDEPKILARIQAGRKIDHFETIRVKKNGDRINVSLTISPVKDQNGKIIGAAKIVRDVTEQRKLEAALHTSERLASVGRLAATVAHEINNPLEAVTNYIYLAKQQPNLPEEIRSYLSSADRELGRVAHIARQTLGFYRDNSRPIEVSIADVINDVLAIYERKAIYKQLELHREIAPGLKIHTFQGDLKQMLSNLIANSIDASKDCGKIFIRARGSKDLVTGQQGIRITVADTGVGIAEADKSKVFDPFFTTKKEVGTGLGLWITKDILTRKGGSIHFRSRTSDPTGTVMSIFIPTLVEEPVGQISRN
jgi:PAS domain S-box-containing protein